MSKAFPCNDQITMPSATTEYDYSVTSHECPARVILRGTDIVSIKQCLKEVGGRQPVCFFVIDGFAFSW